MDSFNRRAILAATSSAFTSLLLASCGDGGGSAAPSPTPSPAPSPTPTPLGYGALTTDPAGLLDLPDRFSYRILSSRGDVMSDGGRVPDNADGMGCIQLPDGKLALVRNHELSPGQDSGGATGAAYDRTAGGTILPGGTTTLVLNPATLAVERQFRSLSGTIRNCAGGVTPWGSWLSCEEDTTVPGSNANLSHGYVFDVPASASGPIVAAPLIAMGRFRHEAAVVDPASGYVYQTEDRDDGLLYRFIPAQPGNLAAGGRLQALVVDGLTDSRNWTATNIPVGQFSAVRWIDLSQPESPADDLRLRGLAAGAMRFARGEGIYMGSGELYFMCTSGGAARIGQVFRLTLASNAERLQLFFESTATSQLHAGDNILVTPDSQLIICEDQGTTPVDNYLRGIARDGRSYPIARLRIQTELAGACFSPDARTLFLNIYSPTKTLAISGPWAHL